MYRIYKAYEYEDILHIKHIYIDLAYVCESRRIAENLAFKLDRFHLCKITRRRGYVQHSWLVFALYLWKYNTEWLET